MLSFTSRNDKATNRTGGTTGGLTFLLLAICLCAGHAAAQLDAPVPLGPDIEVQGKGVVITDGDTTPDVGDDTEFGGVAIAGGSEVHTFTILNTGADPLTLGEPPVTIGGAADFAVTSPPTSPPPAERFVGPATVGPVVLPPGTSTTFEITFDPTDVGLRQATVSIPSDDPDENPYDFNIQGTGIGSTVTVDGGAADDSFTVSIVGGNIRISNPNGVTASPPDTTQIDPNTVEVNSATVGAIVINGGDGNDTLTIDFANGNFSLPITFNGQGQSGAPGDQLALTGGGTFADVTHTFDNANDGSIDITGNATITYTGLEPVTDNLDAVDRVFTFTGGAETITITNAGSNQTTIDSTLGESVTFNDPTNSLTVNAGTGDDTIDIDTLLAPYPASLILNGDDAADTINFNVAIGLAADRGVTVTAESINLDGASVNTSGTGAQTYNGAVDLGANTTLSAGGNITFDFDGPAGGVDGSNTLNLNTGSDVEFLVPVGNGTPLSMITTDAGGETHIDGGSVQTSASQTYNDAVVIGDDTTISSSGNGAIAFNDALDGPFTLDVNTGGTTTFGGAVGGTTELTALTTDGAGSTSIGANVDVETGATTFGDDVTLTADVIVTGTTDGGVAFNGSVDSDSTPRGLTVTSAANVSFGAPVGGGDPLGAVQISVGGQLSIAADFDLDGSFAQIGAGTVNLGGDITTTDDAISFTGAVTLTDNVALDTGTGGGTIDFNSTLNDDALGGSDQTLTIDAGTGDVDFDQTVGGTQPPATITITSAGVVTSVQLEVATAYSATATTININDNIIGGGSVTLSPSATATFAGAANSYAGTTTLSDGITTVDAGAAITVSNVTVQTGATLDGEGTIGGTVNVANGGTIAPGTSTGILNTGNFTLSSGATFNAELDGPTAGTDYDQLNVTGPVNLAGDLSLSGTITGNPGAELIIINNDGGDAVVGVFNGIAEGDSITVNGLAGYLTYAGGDGNDVAIVINQGVSVAVTGDVNEDGPATLDFTFTRVGNTTDPLTINFDVNGTANFLGDYTQTGAASFDASTGTVTILAGDTQATVIIDPTDDTTVELDETVQLTIAAGLGYNIGGGSSATGTVLDEDQTKLTISDVTLIEGNIFTFMVTADNAVDVSYTIDFATDDDTATTADGDYLAATGTVTFAGNAGESQPVQVTVLNDLKVEDDETFNVDLTNIVSSLRDVVFDDNQAVGTILNEDAATLSIDNVTADEGDAGSANFTFTVTLDREVDTAFTVDYESVDGTATTADGDYTADNGTLNFAGNAGETQTINISVNGDTKVEPDEAFEVLLSSITSTQDVTFDEDTGVGTITNDDANTVSVADYEADETDSGLTAFNFVVTMTGPSDADVDVPFTVTSGTATFTDADMVTASGNSVIPAGSTTTTLTVLVQGDNKVELNETFTVTLSTLNTNGRTITIQDGTAEGTILNDEVAKFTIDDVGGDEGDSSTNDRVFTVTLDNPVDTAITVDFDTADATAKVSDSDYVANSGTLNFAGNQGETHTITVLVNGDTRIELDETFVVDLSNVQSNGRNVQLAAKKTGVGAIDNDDGANFSIDDVTMAEGDTGTTNFVFTVTLDEDIDVPITVDFATANDTAMTTDADYLANSGTLNFAGLKNETQQITVQITGDEKVELDEQFRVNLSNIQATGRVVGFDDSVGVGEITNEDAATFSIDDVTRDENNPGPTNFVFTVTLDAAVDVPVTVDFDTADDTAEDENGDDDYVSNSGTLNFAGNAGETQTVTVVVNGDAKVELNEFFHVDLSNVAANTRDVTIDDGQGEGTIVNDDAATLSIDDVTLAEGDTGTTDFVFKVTLSAEVDNQVTVDFQSADGEAKTSDSDYTAVSGSGGTALVFDGNAGEQETITVPVTGDEKVELIETFVVNLTGFTAGGRNVSITDNQGLGTINNDDSASFSIDDVSKVETDSGTTDFVFTVTLSNEVDTNLTVDYSTADDTATTSSGDYDSNSGTLNFTGSTAGETQTITVTVNGDEVVEPDETFVVNLPAFTNGGRDVTIADNQGEGTIENDDSAKISIDDVTLAENDSGTTFFTFTVTLDTAVDNAVDVDFATADDSATTGDNDYTAVSGSGASALKFTGNKNETKTVTVEVQADTKVELTEQFEVNLSNIAAGGRDVTFSDDQGIGTITNDDAATLSIDDVTINEGDAGTTTFTFTVTLDNEVDTAISTDYDTADGLAKVTDNDYTTSTGTLNFAGSAGETQQLTVNVKGDIRVENNDTFFVDLSNLSVSGRNVSYADDQGLGTITNDDATALSIDDVTVNELDTGSVDAVFTVSLTNPSELPVTVDYAAANNSAAVGLDFTATAGTLTIPMDTLTATITVPVLGDVLEEPNETYFVNLSNPAVATIADGQGVGTIIDNEEPPVIGSFTADPINGTVGQVITFTTAASDPNGDALTVTLDFGDGNAGSGATTTHAYDSTGTYNVKATVNDGKGGTDTAMVTVTISQIFVGDGEDADGDGFSDTFEAQVGTDPNDASSTPLGTAPASPPVPLQVDTYRSNSRFNTTGKDSVVMKFQVPIPAADFTFANPQLVVVYVGGISHTFSAIPNKKGTSVRQPGQSQIKMVKKTKTNTILGLYRAKLGNFAETWAATSNLNNTTALRETRTIEVIVMFNNTIYRVELNVNYNAKQDKKGTAFKLKG